MHVCFMNECTMYDINSMYCDVSPRNAAGNKAERVAFLIILRKRNIKKQHYKYQPIIWRSSRLYSCQKTNMTAPTSTVDPLAKEFNHNYY